MILDITRLGTVHEILTCPAQTVTSSAEGRNVTHLSHIPDNLIQGAMIAQAELAAVIFM